MDRRKGVGLDLTEKREEKRKKKEERKEGVLKCDKRIV